MKLYLLDFDGTISSRDSMVQFFSFIYPKHLFLFKCLSCLPLLFTYCLGLSTKDKIKSKILITFLAKFSSQELKALAYDFAIFFDQYYIKENARSYIQTILSADCNQLYIVTASLDLWMEPIAKRLNASLISTRSLFMNNKFAGMSGNNCYGIEKVIRIQAAINITDFKNIYAFGDTAGDYEMLSLADHQHYKYF